MGYFRESPRGSQNSQTGRTADDADGLFLMTVTHFEHFVGPRCRTGAAPELGPSSVSFWSHFGPQFGRNLVPVWSQLGPSLVLI